MLFSYFQNKHQIGQKSILTIATICLLIFASPLFAQTPKVLSIKDAMDISENRSFEIKSSENELGFSKTSETLSYFFFGPTLNVRDMYSWYPKSIGVLNLNDKVTNDFSNQALNVEVSQPVTGLLQNIFNTRQKYFARSAANNDLLETRIQTRFQAGQAFVLAEQAMHMRDIYRSAVQIAQKQYADTKTLFETGAADKTKIDVLKTQASYVKEQNNLLQYEKNYANALVDLRNQLNITYDIEVKQESINVKLPEINYFLDTLKRQNPGLKSLQNQIDAISQKQVNDTFEYLPKVNFFTSFAFTSNSAINTDSDVPINLVNKKEAVFYYGFNLTWNVWDGGLTALNTANNSTQKHALQIQKDQNLKGRQDAVQKAYQSLESYLAQLEKEKENVKINEESYQLSRVKYESGGMSATDLIIAQNDLINAQMSLAKVEADLELTWLQLQAVSGIKP